MKQRQLDELNTSTVDTYSKLRENVEKLRTYAQLDPGPVIRPRRETPLTPEEQERLRSKRLAELRPPADPTITSLYIGSVPPSVTQKDLMPYFLEYGEVKELVLDSSRLSAYVTYFQRAAAEKACAAMHQNLNIKGTRVRVMWARKRNRADAGAAPSAHACYGAAASQPPPKAPRRLPPGVQLPPGVAQQVYPSTNPSAMGSNPDRE